MSTQTGIRNLVWEKVHGAGCVYALTFSNGTVKVGKTSHLTSRFNTHVNRMRWQHDAHLVDFYFTRTHAGYSATERLFIKAAESAMTPESSRTGKEWFHNLDRERLEVLLAEADPTGAYTYQPPWRSA